MTWRDTLLTASFRGVTFKVQRAESSGGRRGVVHEYPMRDEPYVEDMGRRARSFSIEGFVVGDDYNVRRNALQDALEVSGVGTLVHPYQGSKQVVCLNYRIQETVEDGRIARFTMEFAESFGQGIYPSRGLDYRGLLNTSVDTTLLSSATSLIATYATQLQPQFSVQSLIDSVTDLGGLWRKLMLPKVADVQSRAVLTKMLDEYVADSATIARSPVALSSKTEDIVKQFREASVSNLDTMNVMLATTSFTSGSDPLTSAAVRKVEKKNRDALFGYIHRVSVAEAARAAVDVPFVSYDEALAYRNQIADVIDDELEVADDTVFPVLMTLRKEVVRAIPKNSETLPRILEIKPLATQNSLALTYRLYGSVSREADVIARNNIRHPGFVQGGRTIKVLSNA